MKDIKLNMLGALLKINGLNILSKRIRLLDLFKKFIK